MKRYLILENGKTFCGEAFGADKDVIAEIVFTTSMTGYLETLTDKSYHGQAVVQTFPMIGNYGIIPEDREGDSVGPKAYIVGECCDFPSNFRSEGTLDSFLKANGIPGLSGIDTRALTRLLREHGTMNGFITDNPDAFDKKAVSEYRIINPISETSRKKILRLTAENAKKTVAVLDFGIKENMLRCLSRRGCNLTVFPYNTPAKEILAENPDGIFLSNGPGDPADPYNAGIVSTIKELFESKIPLMGICLGHQLLALANGFSTSKLKYGHRGANHPARMSDTGRIFITSQNHGYAVNIDSVDSATAQILSVNVNDNTCEGLLYKKSPAFSVQFHPEACGGPLDTAFLFDRFTDMMEAK